MVDDYKGLSYSSYKEIHREKKLALSKVREISHAFIESCLAVELVQEHYFSEMLNE